MSSFLWSADYSLNWIKTYETSSYFETFEFMVCRKRRFKLKHDSNWCRFDGLNFIVPQHLNNFVFLRLLISFNSKFFQEMKHKTSVTSNKVSLKYLNKRHFIWKMTQICYITAIENQLNQFLKWQTDKLLLHKEANIRATALTTHIKQIF